MSISPVLPRIGSLTSEEIACYLDRYASAIALKSSSSSSSSSSLESLDEWYQSLEPLRNIKDLKQSIWDKATLLKLVRWKLAREKHRPTLLSLVSSNPSEVCEQVLQRAANHLLAARVSPKATQDATAFKLIDSTMRIIAELKGIGPATSSAIVAAWTINGIFQSDELAMAVMGKHVKIYYTWPFYKKFYHNACDVWKHLQQADDGRVLERLAWSIAYNPPAVESAHSGHEVVVDDQPESRSHAVSQKAVSQGEDKANAISEMTASKRTKRKSKTKTDPTDDAEPVGQTRRSQRIRTQA